MNVLTDTAAGLRALTPTEAAMRISQLEDRLAYAECDEQIRIQREIESLRPIAEPERAYSACYEPRGYVPGWVA